MLKLLAIYILFIFTSLPAFSEVRVIFVEVKGYGGRQIQLEKDGRFAHVAISYDGQWLQSMPKHGVELVSYSDLLKMGKLIMLKSTQGSEPTADFVAQNLGKSFELEFSWESENFYCSKLVGKILNLTPQPMSFNSRAWGPVFQKFNGQLGLSPDDVYEQLLDRGFFHAGRKPTADPNSCRALL